MTSLEDVVEWFPALAKLGKAADGAIPLVHQTMATDCGAACLAMILAFHGRHLTLEELRSSMTVGRDGVTARAIVETGGLYGLMGRGVKIEVEALPHLPRASVLYLDFSHFVVLDRVDERGIHLVDPAYGRRTMSFADARRSFTGVAILFEKSLHFAKSAKPVNPIVRHLKLALTGSSAFGRIALVSVLLQLMSLLFPLMQGRIADRVLPRNDLHLLVVLLCGLATTVVFYLVASITRSQLLLYLRTRFDARLTLGFVQHMLRLPYDFFERRQVGDLQMRVGSVATVREALTGAVLSALIDGVLVLSHLVFLIVMSIKMTVVALCLVMLQITVYVFSQRKLMELAGGSIAKQAEAANALNELLVGVESLKASGCEHAASQHWAGKYVDVMNINLRRGGVSSFSDAVLGAINVIGPMALLVAGTFDVLEHNMGLGTMLSANAMAVGFIHPMMSLVGTLQSLVMIKVHLHRIDDVLATSPEQSGKTRVTPQLRGEIVLHRVSFRYGPRLPQVVNDVSLRVKAGECIAIVGTSGSGKTTLGRLLLGLYAPTSGSVSFDGMNLSQLDLSSLRRQLGVVIQRPHIFGTTVRGNIALAEPSVSLEQVRHAAQFACIHDDVARMPMQYDTPVVAGGASLSGGQRQRLALARALVHQPAVLLLDEATSALDAVTESTVQANLERLSCTRILIAHRLSTVMRADRILVMEQGVIVEQGTHQQLLARGGAYARLVAAQLGEVPRPAAASRGISVEQLVLARTQMARPRTPPPVPSRARRAGAVVRSISDARRARDPLEMAAAAGAPAYDREGELPTRTFDGRTLLRRYP